MTVSKNLPSVEDNIIKLNREVEDLPELFEWGPYQQTTYRAANPDSSAEDRQIALEERANLVSAYRKTGVLPRVYSRSENEDQPHPLLVSEVSTASTIVDLNEGYEEQFTKIVGDLKTSIEKTERGQTTDITSSLVSQGKLLESLMFHLIRKSNSTLDPRHSLEWMRLALKAQAQGVSTLEAFGRIKNPQIRISQQNIAHNQQVINEKNSPNELMDEK